MREIDNFYLQQDEPVKGTFLALRGVIMKQDKNITEEWKYKMPFFCYKGKMFCYLWFHKKFKQPYIGIVEGKLFDEPFLIQEGRSRMKIMLFDPTKDLPVKTIDRILRKVLDYYRTGKIPIK